MNIKFPDVPVVAEIGCGDFRSCAFRDFEFNYNLLYLFEPNIVFYKDLVQNIKGENSIINKFILNNVAIGDSDGLEWFYNFGYTSFLKGSDSPINTWVTKDSPSQPEVFYKKMSCLVEVIDAAHLDKRIDLLILTCSGLEARILNRLPFRPKFIRTKYYMHTHEQMAYCSKISNWMMKNGYSGNLMDRNEFGTYNDVMFVKR